mgnify:CR=1 FL=1
MQINIIACIDKNGGLGYQNKLLFHIKKDMERFRMLTTGHTIIMGRKTYDSLPNGALPYRRNIVISHQDLNLPHCEIYHSMREALVACKNDEVFVIGGASIYEQAMEIANKLYITKVEEESPNVDTYFPTINQREWNIYACDTFTERKSNRNKTFHYSFLTYKKSIKCPQEQREGGIFYPKQVL